MPMDHIVVPEMSSSPLLPLQFLIAIHAIANYQATIIALTFSVQNPILQLLSQRHPYDLSQLKFPVRLYT